MEDATLYAKWIPNTYTITFNSQGGSAVAAQIVTYPAPIAKPSSPPLRNGYTFGEWYEDAKCSNNKKWDFSTVLTKNITLYAKWSSVYTGQPLNTLEVRNSTGTLVSLSPSIFDHTHYDYTCNVPRHTRTVCITARSPEKEAVVTQTGGSECHALNQSTIPTIIEVTVSIPPYNTVVYTITVTHQSVQQKPRIIRPVRRRCPCDPLKSDVCPTH
jgi:uncharacterized repeat protein (TIGR02543 family)